MCYSVVKERFVISYQNCNLAHRGKTIFLLFFQNILFFLSDWSILSASSQIPASSFQRTMLFCFWLMILLLAGFEKWRIKKTTDFADFHRFYIPRKTRKTQKIEFTLERQRSQGALGISNLRMHTNRHELLLTQNGEWRIKNEGKHRFHWFTRILRQGEIATGSHGPGG